MKFILAVCAAVAGAIGGSRWIASLYAQKKDILSFPHKTSDQNQKRSRFLPAILGILFAFYLLSTDASVTTLFFSLFYLYFLVIFSVTDWEQQVIFDRMLIPFAILGCLFTLVCGAGITNHLLAALGGGALFLLLAILTKGGIGGGDIKLIAALGLWLGVNSLADVITIGLIAGGIGAFILLKWGNKKRTDTFAYGPYFAIAALAKLLL